MNLADMQHLDQMVQMTDKEDARLPRLENWQPDERRNYLWGNVYNHPKLQDGDYVHTSRIKWRTATYCQTLNTLYVLGKKYEGYKGE